MDNVNLPNIKERLRFVYEALEKDKYVEKHFYLELMNLYQCMKDLEKEDDKLTELAQKIREVL